MPEGRYCFVSGADDEEVTRTLLELVGIGQEYGIKFPRDFGLLVKQALYFDRYSILTHTHAHTHARTHTRTHARAHTHTHTHTHSVDSVTHT